jgi:hypothetical protein
MMFECTLVDKKGFIQEFFYRDGENEQEVLQALECFCWPSGTWEIKQHGGGDTSYWEEDDDD